jgi:hypothetical protein
MAKFHAWSKGVSYDSGHIDTIVALAERNRLARIWYQKLGMDSTTIRLVEPYSFVESQAGALCVRTWQVDPTCDGGVSWRCFRADRITDVSDGGMTFEPRCRVDLALGIVRTFANGGGLKKEELEDAGAPGAAPADPVTAYRDFLISAVRDRHFDERERTAAENLANKVPTYAMKVVHSQVFADVLFDALLDHRIDEAEEAFIDDVRGFMETIGWAP